MPPFDATLPLDVSAAFRFPGSGGGQYRHAHGFRTPPLVLSDLEAKDRRHRALRASPPQGGCYGSFTSMLRALAAPRGGPPDYGLHRFRGICWADAGTDRRNWRIGTEVVLESPDTELKVGSQVVATGASHRLYQVGRISGRLALDRSRRCQRLGEEGPGRHIPPGDGAV